MKIIKPYTNHVNENSDNLASIFKSLHSAINKDDLLSLQDLVYSEVDHQLVPSIEDFEEIIDYLDVEPEYLYIDQKNFISPVCYWKDGNFYAFHGPFNIEALKMFRAADAIKYNEKRLESARSKGEYELYFAIADKKIIIPLFIDMFNEIPDDKKYDVFTDLYVRSEYGFGIFPKNIIEQCFKLREKSSDWHKRMDELDKEIQLDENGQVEIYRGVGTNSSSDTDAFSWTLSKETAGFFANRFSKGKGKVISKKIDKSQIIDYLTTRGESEVIVMPPKFL